MVVTHFVRQIGQYVAEFIFQLKKRGLNLKMVTLIGDSVGSHVFGYAGYLLKGKIGAIYGKKKPQIFFAAVFD